MAAAGIPQSFHVMLLYPGQSPDCPSVRSPELPSIHLDRLLLRLLRSLVVDHFEPLTENLQPLNYPINLCNKYKKFCLGIEELHYHKGEVPIEVSLASLDAKLVQFLESLCFSTLNKLHSSSRATFKDFCSK
jgi:hypothetical protein